MQHKAQHRTIGAAVLALAVINNPVARSCGPSVPARGIGGLSRSILLAHPGSWCASSPRHDWEELPVPRRDAVQADAEVAGPGADPCLQPCTDLCPCVLGVTLQQPVRRLHLGPGGKGLRPDSMQMGHRRP